MLAQHPSIDVFVCVYCLNDPCSPSSYNDAMACNLFKHLSPLQSSIRYNVKTSFFVSTSTSPVWPYDWILNELITACNIDVQHILPLFASCRQTNYINWLKLFSPFHLIAMQTHRYYHYFIIIIQQRLLRRRLRVGIKVHRSTIMLHTHCGVVQSSKAYP